MRRIPSGSTRKWISFRPTPSRGSCVRPSTSAAPRDSRRLPAADEGFRLEAAVLTRPWWRQTRLPDEVSVMARGDSLAQTVEATQRSLQERLEEALLPHRDPHRPRDDYAATDPFMAATSRHLAAIEAVMLEPVRRSVPEGDEPVPRVPSRSSRTRAHPRADQGAAVRAGARDSSGLARALGDGDNPAQPAQQDRTPDGGRVDPARRPPGGRGTGTARVRRRDPPAPTPATSILATHRASRPRGPPDVGAG